MNRYSKSHIEELALTHPMICAHLNAQRTNPGIAWQDMLHSLVVALAEENAALQAMLIHEKQNASNRHTTAPNARNVSIANLADDIAAAICCARNAAEGRNNRVVENTDFRRKLSPDERRNEFMECRAFLFRLAAELGMPESELVARGA